MPRDESITLEMDEPKAKKPPSEAKLKQLEAAREKALLSRRRALKNKLETKLSELRAILGNDMRPETTERFAKAMMAQEDRLRQRQNSLSEQLRDAITDFRHELEALRACITQSASTRVKTLASIPESRSSGKTPKPHTASHVSTNSSSSVRITR